MFEITILGNNAALPAYGRNTSAQFVRIQNEGFLIDCGEATQIQFQKFGVSPNDVDYVLITHLHGDHYFGLIGLLTSMSLNSRTKILKIFSPARLREIIDLQLLVSDTKLMFEVEFIEVDTEKHLKILETESTIVHSIPLKHRIACAGYLLQEAPKPLNINPLKIEKGEISVEMILKLKKGEDITDTTGKITHKVSDYTLPPKKPRSYAYCSDTIFLPELAQILKNTDVLYHETTFLKNEEERASRTFHSTTFQAATLANLASVGQLIVGHFSSRYQDLEVFENECREIFKNAHLAIQGKKFIL